MKKSEIKSWGLYIAIGLAAGLALSAVKEIHYKATRGTAQAIYDFEVVSNGREEYIKDFTGMTNWVYDERILSRTSSDGREISVAISYKKESGKVSDLMVAGLPRNECSKQGAMPIVVDVNSESVTLKDGSLREFKQIICWLNGEKAV